MSIQQLAIMNLEQYQYYCPWKKGTKCGYDGMDMVVPWMQITTGSRATWFLQWYKYYQLMTLNKTYNSTSLTSIILTINFKYVLACRSSGISCMFTTDHCFKHAIRNGCICTLGSITQPSPTYEFWYFWETGTTPYDLCNGVAAGVIHSCCVWDIFKPCK